jgi:uncharacterized protein involved in exopolysaccharide biosynthesis
VAAVNIFYFIRILIRNLALICGIPLILAVLMYLLTADQKGSYSSSTTIFTAITSNVSIENIDGGRVDYFAAVNAYNNLMNIIRSKSVMEEVSLRLFARHLMCKAPEFRVINKESFRELQEIVPEEVRALAVPGNEEQTYQNLKNYMQADKDNFVYGLFHLNHRHYSHKALKDIKVVRLGDSDIIQLSYESDDAGVCFQTLKILSEVFIRVNGSMKRNQTDVAVEYFEEQLEKAAKDLRTEEDRLLRFNTTNEIINYYEQTKHISSQQEKIEVKLQDVLMEYNAAKAVLDALEEETQNRFDINLRNQAVLSLREELIEVNEQIAALELEEGPNLERRESLVARRIMLENKLEERINSLYLYERNSEGIEIEKLLDDWLTTVIQFESAGARLRAMEEKQRDFMKEYRRFAPLGATLKRIERKIAVNEEAYLEILHHLGLARLKQQNADMMADMKVLDPPQIPIERSPTKRKILVIVITLFGGIFTVLAIFVLELLDRRIKNSTKLAQLTKLEAAVVFAREQATPKFDFEKLRYRSSRYMVDNITGALPPYQHFRPGIILLLSHWDDEGKSYVRRQIMEQLTDDGHFCYSLVYNLEDVTDEGYPYLILNPRNLNDCKSYEEYLRMHHPAVYQKGGYVLVEIPSISDGITNTALLQSADLVYLVVDATRTWNQADKTYLHKLNQIIGKNLYPVLNKAHPDNMEDFIGEIPKRRNGIVRFVKHRLLKRYV